ncbi:MAG: aspartyl-tRNA synthetase, partial [Frankiaceae bacterium]|nr:aspartyl-tRNA synthetase [Frankiaceae bacterium]
MIRDRNAGTLRAEDVGSTVTLAGWVAHRRDHGGVIFIDLRDGSGVVQCVLREDGVTQAAVGPNELRSEFCLRVIGEVSTRPEGNENPELPSGAIEVLVTSYDVLSTSEALPFPIDGHTDVGEERRLRYRYLDLRSAAGPGAALRTRSKVTNAARRVMERHDFLEIETPYLTRSTPEGARDFLVPVRLQPGSWYALPQSPQLFKQLLMVAGMERYYQFARCFRDEDARADRLPEFTQLDLEMA